jgi:hypothetical protein
VTCIKAVPATLLSAVLFASSAEAVSVTNRDDADHKVTVIEGDARQDHVVKAGGTLEGICQKGCLVRLDDSTDDPFELEGPEVTWIEGGELLEEQRDEAPAVPEGSAGSP